MTSGERTDWNGVKQEGQWRTFQVFEVSNGDGLDQGGSSRGRKKWTNEGHWKDSVSPGLSD